jgi:hypothetical protein
MHNLWGIAITIIGLLMFLAGLTKTEFIVYRFVAARSRSLWGNRVHSFYIVAGLMAAVFGVLVALGFIHR